MTISILPQDLIEHLGQLMRVVLKQEQLFQIIVA
jgi:hypothetical protein